MRILLTGGGSGGHVFPLIAVARKLIQRDEAAELLFIGPDKSSKETFGKEGINAVSILSGKFRRYFSPFFIVDVLKLPIGFLQAYWHIFWFMPDVVFSKGGYGSVLPVVIAWLFRIPVIIHESDSVPGFTNKILAGFSRRVIVSFPESAKFFPENKTVVTGNPIREELFTKVPKDPGYVLGISSENPKVLILGGSQGAKQINELLMPALPDFIKKYEIIHQCGEKNFTNMQKIAFLELESSEEKKMYHLYPFLSQDQLASAYALADIIVSRAGSGAIFEIAASGKPSILIPYMAAAGGHQMKNAQIYKDAGAARVLRGRNIMPHMLESLIDSILGNKEKAAEMSSAARNFSKPDAAGKIAEEIVRLMY